MDSTVVIAGIGLFTTLGAAGLTAYLQRSSQRESRIFEARVASYAALVSALYEYERASYNRVKARLTKGQTGIASPIARKLGRVTPRRAPRSESLRF